jgi:hypothetical protein
MSAKSYSAASADDRREIRAEFGLLDTSTCGEDFGAGVDEAKGHSAPHATTGAGHERDLFTQGCHVSL